MSSLESNKNLAGIGSILANVPIIEHSRHNTGLHRHERLSEYYKDESIYHDALRGLIFLIIAVVAIAVAVPLFILAASFSIFALGPLGVGFGLISLLLASCCCIRILPVSCNESEESFQCSFREVRRTLV